MFFQDFKFYVDILEEASAQQFRHTHRESDYQTWSYEHFITIGLHRSGVHIFLEMFS